MAPIFQICDDREMPSSIVEQRGVICRQKKRSQRNRKMYNNCQLFTKWTKNWNPGTEERSAASTLSTSCGWTPSTTPSPSFLSPLWFLSFPALYLLQYFPSRRKWLPPVCWFIDYSDIQWEFCSFFNGSFFFNESGHFLYKPQKTSLVKWTHFPGHSLSLWPGHLQRP